MRDESESSGGVNVGVLVGALVGSVVGVIILAVLIIVVVKKCDSRNKKDALRDKDALYDVFQC